MFEKVKAAIADVEASENAYESAVASNATAQAALTNAQATASAALGNATAASNDLKDKAEALKAALTEFEGLIGL